MFIPTKFATKCAIQGCYNEVMPWKDEYASGHITRKITLDFDRYEVVVAVCSEHMPSIRR